MLGQVEAQIAAAAKFAKKHGGVSGGEENGRAGYNVTMAIACTFIACSANLQLHRHHPRLSGTAYGLGLFGCADIADFMAEHGIQGETFETCCNWDRIDFVIEAAKMEATIQHEKHGLIGALARDLARGVDFCCDA